MCQTLGVEGLGGQCCVNCHTNQLVQKQFVRPNKSHSNHLVTNFYALPLLHYNLRLFYDKLSNFAISLLSQSFSLYRLWPPWLQIVNLQGICHVTTSLSCLCDKLSLPTLFLSLLSHPHLCKECLLLLLRNMCVQSENKKCNQHVLHQTTQVAQTAHTDGKSVQNDFYTREIYADRISFKQRLYRSFWYNMKGLLYRNSTVVEQTT